MNNQKQRGMVLLVSLILLLMLTLIAITASSQSTLQLRISSNSEQRTMAFQAAEAGIANWVGTYFATPLEDLKKIHRTDALPALATASSLAVSTGTHATVDRDKSLVRPQEGSSLASGNGVMMYSFDLVVEGGSVCSGGTCDVKTIHRQGGQRRGPLGGND